MCFRCHGKLQPAENQYHAFFFPHWVLPDQWHDRHAWDWFWGLSLIMSCRRLNCLFKSNYQAVCVAYKIGAATRGGEDWEGWEREREIASRGETHCLAGRYEEFHWRKTFYTRCLETVVYSEWGLRFICLSSYQIKVEAWSSGDILGNALICFLAES